MIGLDLDQLPVDGCITKAPSGREAVGRSPVDRGKQGFEGVALVVLPRFIQEARDRDRYRWPGRPTVRRLK